MSDSVHLYDAARAHTTLNVFALVQAILESGAIYGGNRRAEKIIKLCQEEMQVQLGKFDRAKERNER